MRGLQCYLRKLLENPEPGQHRYMHNAGFPETREYVAAQMQGETGLAFEASDVVMCIGAGGGLNVVLKTLLDPEDEVVALTPFFCNEECTGAERDGKRAAFSDFAKDHAISSRTT